MYFEGENLRKHREGRGYSLLRIRRRLSIYTSDALAIGPRHPEHPNASELMFDAHLYEGTIALWDGDVTTARAHLKALTTVPATGGMLFKEGGQQPVDQIFAESRERDSVVDYCERMAGCQYRGASAPDGDGAGDSRGQNVAGVGTMLTEGEAGR